MAENSLIVSFIIIVFINNAGYDLKALILYEVSGLQAMLSFYLVFFQQIIDSHSPARWMVVVRSKAYKNMKNPLILHIFDTPLIVNGFQAPKMIYTIDFSAFHSINFLLHQNAH